MKNIAVNIKASSEVTYELVIGEGLLEKVSDLFDFSIYTNIAIVTDSNLKKYTEKLKNNLHIKALVIELNPGEENKNIKNVQLVWQKLIDSGFDRKSLLINLGGGVITDIGGFAASTYMRGIDFINIPTTLLSQVDASIGGKTGINFSKVKNLIGSFSQPKAVIIDVRTLSTLPDREFSSGFAEIIKHGLIQNREYFNFITSKLPREFSDEELIEIIATSCKIKKNIVEKDAKETGARKLLNFGHTIGHAIEALGLETTTPLLHGEAISIGMVAEAKLSNLSGLISEEDLKLIENSITKIGLSFKTNLNQASIIEKIKTDKKNERQTINFTLLKNIGEALINQKPSDGLVIEALEYIAE